VLHFPGFEPLSAGDHHARYKRSAEQTARLWNVAIEVGPMYANGRDRYFDVDSEGSGWRTSNRIYILDHSDLVSRLNKRSLYKRLGSGFLSGARVVMEGGAKGYFAHAWRFGLFFIFPFMLVILAIAVSVAIAAYPYWMNLQPVHYVLSAGGACIFFICIFLPWSEKFHTLHLFSDWELAVALARLNDRHINRWLQARVESVRAALNEEADEYLVSSHSMGSSVAAHVLAMVLEEKPGVLKGKRIVFATLGGAIPQVSLINSATVLRRRIGAIARAPEIFWFEIHCRTDPIHLYKTRVVALAGHHDAVQPRVVTIRVRHMLSPDHYRKIRYDPLRVHRQYVLGADVRAPFDFTLMTAGPLPAASFADFSREMLPQF
jgi:hypothetical protein